MIVFTWSHLWSFYRALESQENQKHLEGEVIGDNWLKNQPWREQVEVLRDAPPEFVKKVVPLLKPQTLIFFKINPYLGDKQ